MWFFDCSCVKKIARLFLPHAEEKMSPGTRLWKRDRSLLSIFIIRVLVFIEAMNMLPNPLVFRTLAEYKRRIFGQYKASDTAGKVFLGNFLGAQSLLGLQRAYNQLMKDGKYIACHFFFPLRVWTFFGWVWHKLLQEWRRHVFLLGGWGPGMRLLTLSPVSLEPSSMIACYLGNPEEVGS